ncbi:hypothetical protein [Lucifera butyrica]|uniref:hypothetical protein n=1 Tax=Lucifera butyrica TaxID=1351585 RepID=UPI001401D913|nr:hypothetical protein [Lucifera butyrica]
MAFEQFRQNSAVFFGVAQQDYQREAVIVVWQLAWLVVVTGLLVFMLSRSITKPLAKL